MESLSQRNKFWVALIGAAGIGLVSFDVVDAGQADAIVNSVLALFTAFAVERVPNK